MTTFVTMILAAAVWSASQATDDELRARAERLHREAIVLDTHADLTPFIEKDTKQVEITDPSLAGDAYDPKSDPLHAEITGPWVASIPQGPWKFTEKHSDGYMDLPRMREGGLDAEFFAIYVEEEPRPGMAVKRAFGQIEAILALCDKYPGEVALATTAEDVRRIAASGRIGALMGVEGGYMIEDDLRVLGLFHRLGVRYMSLTHSFNTHWADSSGTGEPVPPRHRGLSPFGVEVVKEMNRLGMMVDISHTADSTFYDVLEATEAPVIASHSSVDGVKEHARNLSDDMLRALAKNGGVIHIDTVIKYIDPVERPKTPLSVFIDHVAHAIEIAGADHVGLGLDYGYDAPAPEGLEHIGKLGAVTYELLKRGYDEETVRKILGKNTLRVMAEVERTAKRLRERR